MKKVLIFFIFGLLIISQTKGQFTLKGEFRPRFEYRGGYGEILSKDEKPILTISQRSRLSAYYQTGIFSFGFGIQDVRVWGDDDMYSSTGVTGSKSSIDLNEAWLGIKPYQNGLIKIGRQYWIYEDERLLSSRGWNQSEIKYDAVLFQHIQDKLQFDVGLSWNNLSEKNYYDEYTSAKMKSLNFIYLKKGITNWLNVSVMALASGFTATDTTPDINWQGTYGGYLGIKKGGLSAMVSGFYQNGKNRKGLETSAYMFAISGDYIFKKAFSIGAGIDYLSGNDQKKINYPDYGEKSHSFDNLYGVRHRVFGHLDLFNNLPKATGDGGIMDIFLRLKWNPVTNTTLAADFHFFSLENNVIDALPPMQTSYIPKGLGQELDLNISWDISKIVNLKGGYSCYLVTDSMEKLQGIEPGNSRFPSWVWVMITAKPVFLEK
ncbi:MAG: alginate export family protein [Bacteroidales bacterium]|nr:alginate export family protein [Bacteroidales bacterium]